MKSQIRVTICDNMNWSEIEFSFTDKKVIYNESDDMKIQIRSWKNIM